MKKVLIRKKLFRKNIWQVLGLKKINDFESKIVDKTNLIMILACFHLSEEGKKSGL